MIGAKVICVDGKQVTHDSGCMRYASFIMILVWLLAMLGVVAPLCAQSFRDDGTAAYQAGDYKMAVELYEKSLAVALRALKEEDPEIIERRAELGEAYRAAGRVEDSIKQFDYIWKRSRFDAEKKKLWAGQEGTTAMGISEKLGLSLLSMGRYEEAIQVFTTALFDAERNQRNDDALQFSALLAEAQFLAKKEVAAAMTVARTSALAEKADNNPTLQSRALSQLASVCLRQKQQGLARPLSLRALEIAQKSEPVDSLKIPDYQTKLAAVLVQTGALEEAEALTKSAREAILKKETAQSVRLVDVLLVDAGISLKKKLPGAALNPAQEALDICRQHFPPIHIQTGRSMKSVADCRMALKQPNLARVFYTDALDILEKTMGADDVITKETREKLAALEKSTAPEKVSPAKSSGKHARGK